MKKILLVVTVCLLSACGKLTVDNTPIESVDLNRYLGSWYEIARFDHRFERGMEQTKALYTLREDGLIKVENSGVKDDDTIALILAEARSRGYDTSKLIWVKQ